MSLEKFLEPNNRQNLPTLSTTDYHCNTCGADVPNNRDKLNKHIETCENAVLEGDLVEDD